jgi:hypothetical protein
MPYSSVGQAHCRRNSGTGRGSGRQVESIKCWFSQGGGAGNLVQTLCYKSERKGARADPPPPTTVTYSSVTCYKSVTCYVFGVVRCLGNVYSRKHRGHKFEPLHALSFWVLFFTSTTADMPYALMWSSAVMFIGYPMSSAMGSCVAGCATFVGNRFGRTWCDAAPHCNCIQTTFN